MHRVVFRINGKGGGVKINLLVGWDRGAFFKNLYKKKIIFRSIKDLEKKRKKDKV